MVLFVFLFFIVRFARVFLRDVEVDTLDTFLSPRHHHSHIDFLSTTTIHIYTDAMTLPPQKTIQCIMQAPGIGSDTTMSLVDNDVAKTVLHEFVYHGIKNLGFDESNVHVHVSNGGGHSDIVVIEWEIELNNQYYKALDTKQFFNHLFKNENWHNHVTSWMKAVSYTHLTLPTILLV